MELQMSDIFSGLIAFGLFFFLIFVVYVIMKREDDIGEIATKKIGNQSLFLLEILLVVANGAEMLTAASIAATNTEFEVSYAGRLILHAVLALTSILGGFAFSKQLKEAFKHWTQPVQWIQVLFSLVLVIIGPLGNLLIMAYSMNQFDALLGYQLVPTGEVYSDGTDVLLRTEVGKWQNVIDGMLDPVLFGTYVVTLIHCFLVIVIATIAYDKVYNVEKPKKGKDSNKDDKKKDKSLGKEPSTDEKGRPNVQASIGIMSDALDGNPTTIELLGLVGKILGKDSKVKNKDQYKGRLQNLSNKYKNQKAKYDQLIKENDGKAIETMSGSMEQTKHKFRSLLKDMKNEQATK